MSPRPYRRGPPGAEGVGGDLVCRRRLDPRADREPNGRCTPQQRTTSRDRRPDAPRRRVARESHITYRLRIGTTFRLDDCPDCRLAIPQSSHDHWPRGRGRGPQSGGPRLQIHAADERAAKRARRAVSVRVIDSPGHLHPRAASPTAPTPHGTSRLRVTDSSSTRTPPGTDS